MSQPRLRAEAVGRAVLASAAVSTIFGIGSLGFYDDDWSWLARMAGSADPSWLGTAAHFARAETSLWFRPLNFLCLPGLFSLFGTSALPYHLVIAALIAWGGIAFWRWLEEEGFSRETSALAALFFVLWPNHDAARHWICIYSSPAAMALTLEAVRMRRRRPLASALTLIAGGLLYEAAMTLALAPFFLEAWRARRRGLVPAIRSAAASCLPLLTGFTAVAVWQRALCPLWLHPERHPMSVHPGHALKVFYSGLECQVLNRLWHLLARQASWAWSHFSPFDWLAWLAAASGLAFLCPRLLPAAADDEDAPALAISLFVLGYAPYILDKDYTPAVFSPINRINFVPSLGAALLAAWALRRLGACGGRRARAAALACAALFAAFLLATWPANAQWGEAARRQRQILDALAPRLGALPAGRATLLLYGFDNYIGTAPVFNSTYDLNAALALIRGSRDVKALIGQGRVRFEDDRAVMSWFGDVDIPYKNLYIYRHDAGRFSAAPDRGAAEAFLAGR